MNKSDYSVDILINDKPVKQFGYQGRTYIEGREGSSYSIRIRNHSSSRVLAVVSVDSIDVLSGKAASIDSGGYIIPAYGNYVIRGFRTSNESVNKFEFSRKSQSYAAKTDEPDIDISNCGVIGCVIHEEKRPAVVYRDRIKKEYIPYPVPTPPITPDPWKPAPNPWQPNPWGPVWSEPTYTMRSSLGDSVQTRSMNMMDTFSASVSEDDFSLGTKFSNEEVKDVVTNTTFERSGVSYLFEIYYTTRRSLERMGVLDNQPKVSLPQAFKDSGFCKPPRR